MEISVIASSQVNYGRSYDSGLFNFGKNLSGRICSLKNNNLKASYLVQNQSLKWPSKSAVGFTLRASASAHSEQNPMISRTKPVDGIKLFVGLPLDTVSSSNKINRARAINAGLKTLKLLGVNGVELPVWWGVAEKEGMGKYDWTSYLTVVEMVQKLGLELHVSLCFHASEECKIRLPDWVSRIGKGNSDIYFVDKSGQHKDCLSFGVDDVPVLNGKTPVEVYKGFCDDFKATFSPFLGSTITSVSIGLGPDGELRYPHHHQPDESDHSQLLSHCDRLLSLASYTFKDSSISISGRVPPVHSWDWNSSVPGWDNYDGVSKIFSRNSCGMILPRMDLSDSGLEEMSSSCRRHGVSVSGENSPASSTSGDVFDRIEKKLHSDASSSVDTFTYQRMGASFFSPDHFALFVRFSRCLNRLVRRFNDVAVRDGRDDEFFLDPRRLQTA